MFKKYENSEMILLAREQSKGRKIWLEILLFIAVFEAASLISSIVMIVPLIADVFRMLAETGDVLYVLEQLETLLFSQKYTLIMLFATVLTTAAVFIYCTKIEKRSFASMGFSRKKAFGEYAAGLGIGFGLFAAALLICVLTGSAEVSFRGGRAGIILLFLLGYLLQGMSEEVVTRGYFMISLARRNRIGWAVIISSVMFSLLHIFNSGVTVLALVNIALFGILMAAYMLRRGNIWGVCAIHSAWNFVQGNIFGVQVSGMDVSESVFATSLCEGMEWLNGGNFGMEGGLAVTLVLLAGIAAILFIGKKQQKRNN